MATKLFPACYFPNGKCLITSWCWTALARPATPGETPNLASNSQLYITGCCLFGRWQKLQVFKCYPRKGMKGDERGTAGHNLMQGILLCILVLRSFSVGTVPLNLLVLPWFDQCLTGRSPPTLICSKCHRDSTHRQEFGVTKPLGETPNHHDARDTHMSTPSATETHTVIMTLSVRYCFQCLKRHAEVRYLNNNPPTT